MELDIGAHNTKATGGATKGQMGGKMRWGPVI